MSGAAAYGPDDFEDRAQYAADLLDGKPLVGVDPGDEDTPTVTDFQALLDAQLKAARRKIGEQLVDMQIRDIAAELAAWKLIDNAKPGEIVRFEIAAPYGLSTPSTCPTCGASLQPNARLDALRCPGCGFTQDIDQEGV